MSIDQNPLTPPPASGPASPPRSPRNTTWITVTTAIIGGLALAGAGTTAAVAASADLSRIDSVQTLDVGGAESLDVDASATDLRVEFRDVDEAELAVHGGRGDWTLDRSGDEILVRSPDSVFGWWFGRWFDDEVSVVLTLPRELEGLDATFRLNAGGLDVSGEYGDLDLQLAAGDLTVDGTAESLSADVSAGSADLALDGVDTADLSVSAGDLTVVLTGDGPRETTIGVSAGSADVTLPDVGYGITQNVSAGSLDNRLEQSSSSRNSIDVTLSAGEVTLRPGR
ncbi:DUF4097 family beta strand repeat-containing protein [Streptomyces sp. AC495_CC817]|uniref:DUF4097 family beta strand repeat-containing protein n=1 Tax=Streptomyces sp. AC495_CC817 TaxID=2823900 RepID=UPI001C25C23A|nr:DUF4097 family beta strand repeat-containing protein [Streptomyces sp. AC495_CC817]